MNSKLSWLVPVALALGLAFPASVLADAPTADAKSPTLNEDTPTDITLSGGDFDGDALTFAIATIPTQGTLGSINTLSCDGLTPSSCTAHVTYSPNANANGPDSFTYTTNDGVTDSGAATVSISITAVNDAPSFTKGSNQTVLEDSGAASVSSWATGLSRGPSDESGQTLSFNVVATDTSLFSSQPQVASNGTLSFTPTADANGSTLVTISISDDGGTANGGTDTSGDQTFTIAITAVNDEPGFTAGSDEVVAEDSGPASFPSWATSPSPGGGSDESGQALNYVIASNTNAALFSAGPAVASNGTLTFTPAANRFGIATVGVQIHDNGGTGNGGDDTSPTQTITITVTAIDDPPIAGNDTGIAIQQNGPAQAINVLANDTYLPDAPETLTITAVTQGAHGAVVITGGGTGLTYQPAAGYAGPDQFTYTIQDSGGSATDQATVSLTVGDATPPTMAAPVETLRTGIQMGSSLAVHIGWNGTDTGSGIHHFVLQRSVDGGAFVTVALPTPTTKSINVLLPVAHYYLYRVRAVDNAGNGAAYVYGPNFKTFRYQENQTVVYTGVWKTTSFISSYSGGFSKYAYTLGYTATITQVGRDFAFVAPKASFRGSARIYVDGVWVATISEKAATSVARQVLWQTHFTTAASHSIRVLVLGNGRIDVDCFLVMR